MCAGGALLRASVPLVLHCDSQLLITVAARLWRESGAGAGQVTLVESPVAPSRGTHLWRGPVRDRALERLRIQT